MKGSRGTIRDNFLMDNGQSKLANLCSLLMLKYSSTCLCCTSRPCLKHKMRWAEFLDSLLKGIESSVR